jgi:tape measure domain-containing protein
VDGGNNEVVIDVVAKFQDKMSRDIKQEEQTVSKFDETVERAQKNTAKFGATHARPTIDVNDRATAKIHEATSSGQSFARRAFNATLDATDKVTKTVDLVRGSCKSFASTVFSATLKVVDKVTEPLRTITDKLLSVKTLIAGMVTGAAAKAFVGAPLALADNLSTASVGFETMLGSASKAQQMMSSIQQFAIATPFGTQDLVKDSQQMLAYGFNAKQIIPTLNAIGNAEAALGGGSEGIQRVIVALGQMKMKGKMSSAEMLQMTDNSINAWKYVAQSMGKTVPEIQKMAEKGLIPADKAVDAIVKGMGEFNGMMDKTANRTASGLMSQIQDTFDIGIITKWGRGLQTGAIKGLSRFNKFLSDIDPTLQKAGTSLEAFGSALSTKVFDVLGRVEDRMTKVFNSDQFKNADLGGKIKIAWDSVIAQPFSTWWDSTGKRKIAKKLSGIGESLGSGITGGITTILGFNEGDAKQQGVNLGSSFISGFMKGFDLQKIGNAFQNFAEQHKVLMVTLGLKLGANLVKGMANGIQSSKTLLDSVKGIFGKKSTGGGAGMSMPSASSVSTMNVLANVVNLAGKTFGGPAGGVPVSGSKSSSLPELPSGRSTPLLEAGEAAAGGSLLQKFGASKAGSLFGNIGTKLGTGAATAGGAALAGTAATAGALTAGVAAVDAGKDFYDSSKLQAGKAQKDKQFQGGTKLGMIGTGAAAGAGIGAIFGGVGAVPGALIGAGVGGVGALIGGNAAGKALSNSTDKGGALNNAGKAVGGFFTKTIPDAAGKFGNSVGNFMSTKVAPAASNAKKAIGDVFTKKVPEAFQTMGTGLGTFFTKSVPQAVQTVGTGVGNFFTNTIPNLFTQQIPYAIGFTAGRFIGFFSNTLPQAFNTLMSGIGGFFVNQVGPALSAVGSAVGGFFTNTIPSFFGMLWTGVSGFFMQTLPAAAATAWGAISTFFTSTLPSFFGMVWNGISGFFAKTLPAIGATVWGAISTFFMSTVPSFFGMLWNGVYGFFTQTLPSALAVVGATVRTFFTSTIPSFFGTLWTGISGFFTQTIPQAAQAAGTSIKTFFTQTLPGAVSSAFSSITDKVKGWVGDAATNIKNFFAGVISNASKGYQQGYASTQTHKASGGLVSRPTTTLLGEEGTPEMVIPLSSRRHDRGVQLWQQAGSALGQRIDAKANGGFGGQIIQFPSRASTDSPAPQPQRVSAGSVVTGTGGTKVVIQEIKIVVEGGTGGDIVQQVKDHKDEIANVVSDAIAEGIEKSQDNTPLEGIA